MAAPPPDESWTIGQVVVWLFSGGGLLTALGGILWFARKDGQKDQALETLRADLDAHVSSDKDMFAELKVQIAENASKQNDRHEENIRAIGALPDKDDFRELRDTVTRQFEAIASLVRSARAPH